MSNERVDSEEHSPFMNHVRAIAGCTPALSCMMGSLRCRQACRLLTPAAARRLVSLGRFEVRLERKLASPGRSLARQEGDKRVPFQTPPRSPQDSCASLRTVEKTASSWVREEECRPRAGLRASESRESGARDLRTRELIQSRAEPPIVCDAA